MEEQEIWKPVPEVVDTEVSNLGRVRSRRGKNGYLLPEGEWRICTLTRDKSERNGGYEKINILGKHWWVHRLVALVHLTPPSELNMEVDHLDTIRWNNAASNLEWVTKEENVKRTALRGNGNTQKLSVEDAREIRTRTQNGERSVDIRLDFPQVSPGTISLIKLGKTFPNL